MIKDNGLLTPKDATVLNGITRQTIMNVAHNLNHDVIECDISVDDAKKCDEAFFTGTAAEVTPIVQIDDIRISNGIPGPVTKKIQGIYFDIIRGKMSQYNQWLTRI